MSLILEEREEKETTKTKEQAQSQMDMDYYKPDRDPHTYAMQKAISSYDDGDDPPSDPYDNDSSDSYDGGSGGVAYFKAEQNLGLGTRLLYSGLVGLLVGSVVGCIKGIYDYLLTGNVDWAELQETVFYSGLGGGIGSFIISKYVKE